MKLLKTKKPLVTVLAALLAFILASCDNISNPGSTSQNSSTETQTGTEGEEEDDDELPPKPTEAATKPDVQTGTFFTSLPNYVIDIDQAKGIALITEYKDYDAYMRSGTTEAKPTEDILGNAFSTTYDWVYAKPDIETGRWVSAYKFDFRGSDYYIYKYGSDYFLESKQPEGSTLDAVNLALYALTSDIKSGWKKPVDTEYVSKENFRSTNQKLHAEFSSDATSVSLYLDDATAVANISNLFFSFSSSYHNGDSIQYKNPEWIIISKTSGSVFIKHIEGERITTYTMSKASE